MLFDEAFELVVAAATEVLSLEQSSIFFFLQSVGLRVKEELEEEEEEEEEEDNEEEVVKPPECISGGVEKTGV